jgi:MFS family permease
MVMLASGLFFRGFTVFVPAMRDSLRLTQAQTNLVFSLARAEGGLEGPLAGWAIDKFGNRAMLIPCVILAAVGYFVFAKYVNGFWSFAIIYLGIISLGNSIAFQHALFAGLNQWFRRRRSLAISTLAAVASLGGLILVPLMSWIIIEFGWRFAFVICGAAYFVAILPVSFFFRNRPEDMGLLPDGDIAPPSITTSGVGGTTRRVFTRDYTVREALHTRAYWLLTLGAGLRQIATIGILISIIPILETKGVGRQAAANLTGVMFGVNFISRLVFGYLGDKWSKSVLLGVTLALESAAFLCLYLGSWNDLRILLLFVFVLFEGMGDGAGVIVWAALGEYYGREKFASLRGIVAFSHSWALVAAPVATGWVFDHFGNFDWALIPGIAVAALASLCFFLIRAPRQLTVET